MRKVVPAILVCDAGTGNLKIAGLTVLDRLAITTHLAGCAPIIIVSEETPSLARAHALGIKTVALRAVPDQPEPALLITGAVLVEPRDLEQVITLGGQLVSSSGSPLPVWMGPPDSQPVRAAGVAVVINDAASIRQAERQFWASLTSNTDGLVDRFLNRPVGRVFSKLLVHTPVSPNQISIVSILIGIVSGWFFAAGQFVLGAIVLQICAIVDCVDGDLARALFKQSLAGKWLDLAGDQVVHFAVFAGIGIGVARMDPSGPALALGASAAIGVLFCFFVIVREMKKPAADRGLLFGKLVDATANRDFSVLLLVLALVGKIEWFLWLAGIGIHVFWIMLLLQRTHAVGKAHPL